MKLIVGVLFLCCAATTFAAPRIVGGDDAPAGKYTYQVSLQFNGRHFCGGSIVDKRWILTAAHCLQKMKPETMSVLVGITRLDDTSARRYQVDRVVAHEGFSLATITNDIGLVHLNEDIEFNDQVEEIPLPSSEFLKTNYPVTLTGWGRLWLQGTAPNDLQAITLKSISNAECQKKKTIWLPKIKATQVCTLTKKGEGACHGDSGGPLVADGVQIGVVSFGLPCARGAPDVFTRVHSYIDWINDHIAALE